ncbi:MAG: peptidoglycan editing factor PgeF [Firmicutes bacterium]|nr:peptidoglycan editing factor PgeF [Bacillota bacterium]
MQEDLLTYRLSEGVGLFELGKMYRPRDIVLAFSTRLGGVSQGPFDSLNLGMHVGDEALAVQENRRRFSRALGITASDWVVGEQVHSNKVISVTDHHRGRGALAKDTAIWGVDGLVTATPGLWLVCFYADCVPMVFWDEKVRVVGIAHGGWRGTLQNVGGEAVKSMVKSFACSPRNIHAIIGPAIGSCCYYVGEDVAEEFRGRFPVGVIGWMDNGITLDLKEANRQQLVASGLIDSQIYVSDLCTACNQELFFSYRRDKSPTGRMVACVGLRDLR